MFRRDNPPLALLAACLLAFGVFIPWLGFYQDDWHFIFYADQGLARLWELSAYDNRPFASWPYIAGFALMGFRPLAWQIVGLLLRWLTAVAFWLFLRTLWPSRAKLVVIPALLFAIYPLYTLQPMAVTYITHWVCYFLYFLSLWLMLAALREPRRLWPLYLLSILLDALQLFTIEYFNGIELLRPVVLWLALGQLPTSTLVRLKKTAGTWLPYLLALAAFIIWRGAVFQSPTEDTNAPTILYELMTAPGSTLLYLAGAAMKDSLLILVDPWSTALAPNLVDFSPAGLVILLLSALTFAGFFAYLKNLGLKEEQPASLTQMALLGGLGLLLGPIPAWVTHQPLYDTNPLWNSRLGMASMFGAAMLVTWVVETLVRTPRQRVILYALLLGLATGALLRWGNLYRNAWTREVSFLNQLAWRAPGLEPGTPLVSEGELLGLMGDYPTAFAVNMIYTQIAGAERLPVWYFPTFEDDATAERIATGSDLTARKFSVRFTGKGESLIPVWYDPAVSPCLHILTPEDAQSRLYSDYLRSLSRRADLTRISSTPQLNEGFIAQALDAPINWCIFFQQAELAAGSDDWPRVLSVWEAARENGLFPSYGAELFPFIEANLASGREAEAAELSETAVSLTNTQALRQSICQVWRRSGVSPSPDLSNRLKCEAPAN